MQRKRCAAESQAPAVKLNKSSGCSPKFVFLLAILPLQPGMETLSRCDAKSELSKCRL